MSCNVCLYMTFIFHFVCVFSRTSASDERTGADSLPSGYFPVFHRRHWLHHEIPQSVYEPSVQQGAGLPTHYRSKPQLRGTTLQLWKISSVCKSSATEETWGGFCGLWTSGPQQQAWNPYHRNRYVGDLKGSSHLNSHLAYLRSKRCMETPCFPWPPQLFFHIHHCYAVLHLIVF